MRDEVCLSSGGRAVKGLDLQRGSGRGRQGDGLDTHLYCPPVFVQLQAVLWDERCRAGWRPQLQKADREERCRAGGRRLQVAARQE